MLDVTREPPQLRKDPIIGRWVIISADRGKRPHDWIVESKKKVGGFCPFCPGNEDKIPPEIIAKRENDSAPNKLGWTIRVVSNKFPALQIEGDLNRREEGIFDLMNGFGAHEVIIECPDHLIELADLHINHIRDVFWIFRERIVDLKKDIRFKYILVFKNHGIAAGASLEHSHSQIIALPIIPKRVVEELNGAQKYYSYKERCIFCDIIRQETQWNSRLVISNPNFIVFEPFAARFPFETWVLPARHSVSFKDISYEDTYELAATIKETLQRLNKALENPPYNFIIHTSPLQDHEFSEYHWHIEIIPIITKVAGFEWGSGFYINPTPPEEAANTLREIQL